MNMHSKDDSILRSDEMQHYKPVILVTGVSSGIGLALARLLWLKDEYRVVVTARKKSLDRLSNEPFKNTDRFWLRPLDVTNQAERNALVEEINREWGGVNILINNAGISYRAVIEHMDDDSEFKQIDTNYLGPMSLIRQVLPGMRRRGHGKIINISSVSGMLAMPTMGSYSASKYALEGASESLWYELKPLGINVSLVQLGFIKSNSFQNVYFTDASQSCEIGRHGAYCDYYESMTPFVARMMSLSQTTPAQVANRILKIIKQENPPLRVPATIDAGIFHLLRRFLPRRFFHNFLFWMLPNSKNWAVKYTNARRN